MTGGSVPGAVLRTLEIERRGLDLLTSALDATLGQALVEAIRLIRAASGRVIVTGMGKSGHIGRKIAATFASTGTPAYFVHPSEASHGDLGMIARNDVILALSWSGETAELKDLIEYSRRFGVPLIALTSMAQSALGRVADCVLELPQAPEACPHGLAPTTSTLMQLALGDALALALLEDRGFTAQDFGLFHPGGKLGARLRYVRDLMHVGDMLPLIGDHGSMPDAILEMSGKSFGCVGVVCAQGFLQGIITDGDLRRHMAPDLMLQPVRAVMTSDPKTAGPDMLASAALEMMNSCTITAVFVVDGDRPVGIVHLHDLLRAGVL